jgi:hypothetical protein
MKHLTLFLIPALAAAQVFSSGSNGSDGDLAFPAAKPGDVIIFDPKDKVMFPPNGLDIDNDNVFHFKSITIPAGVTVRLTHAKLQGPVYWLSQGDVSIVGTLNLDGENGSGTPGTFAAGGPGGYFGGGSRPATDGFGPGAGAKGPSTCVPGQPAYGVGGKNTANEFLVPLVGGSGGGASTNGFGGGGGGGAILLASDSSISIGANGISARGGHGGSWGGAGAGGSVRLVSRWIGGQGHADTIHVVVTTPGSCLAEHGKVRIERLSGVRVGIAGHSSGGSPIDPYIPTGLTNSKVSVLSVGGIAVNATPTGSFDIPDVIIDSKTPLPVVIETLNVPVGTIVSMWIYSEAGEAVKVDFPPLTGASDTRRATATATFPYGFSRGFVRASFTR